MYSRLIILTEVNKRYYFRWTRSARYLQGMTSFLLLYTLHSQAKNHFFGDFQRFPIKNRQVAYTQKYFVDLSECKDFKFTGNTYSK